MRSSASFALLCIALLLATATATGTDSLYTINGTQIFVRSIGSGEPIVIVHGGPGLTHEYLYGPFSSLSDRYRVVFFDQRGCGRSASFGSGDSITMQTLVEDLDQLRMALGFGRINLVGQSWGALIALNYTLSHPDAVKRLLLLEPAPGSREYLPAVQQTIIDRLSPSARQRLGSIAQRPELRSDPDLFREFLVLRTDTYFFDTTFARLPRFDYFNAETVKKFFASSAMFGPYMMSFDLYEQIRSISRPTLIIHGDDDVIPTEAIQRMGSAIRDSEVHVIPRCGHFVHVERPEAYFGLVRKFLQRPASSEGSSQN